METRSKAYFDERVAREMAEHFHFPDWSVKQKLALTCQMLAAEGHESGLAGQISAVPRFGDGPRSFRVPLSCYPVC